MHKRRHYGNYPYNCNVCGRGFNDPSNLEGHMSTHTNRKPFRCPLCGNEFSYKQNFKAHLKSQHNIKEEERLKQIIQSTKYVTDLIHRK